MEKLIQEIVKKAVEEAMLPFFDQIQIHNPNQQETELLTTKEACEFLKISSENTLKTLCIHHNVLPEKLGGRNRYKLSDLRGMIGNDNRGNPPLFN
jgi:hypothetical protein